MRKMKIGRAAEIYMVSAPWSRVMQGCIVMCVLILFGCTRPASVEDITTGSNVTSGGYNNMYEHTEGYITPETTGIRHWYQRTGPTNATPVILINGSDTPDIVWHQDFVDSLLSEGFQVIRYDPRDCGRSERLPWPKGFKPRSWSPEASAPPYPLNAFADDLSGLLDELGIEKAHIIGISMGGMIAQLMGIDYPDRVISLSLLSTSPTNSFDPELAPVEQERMNTIITLMEKAGMQSVFSFILGERWIQSLSDAMQVVTGASDGGHDNEMLIRETESIGGYNMKSSHGFAIAAAPSRVAELHRITVPTLILHGTLDPWFSYAHAEKMASSIEGAKLVPIEGEGHASPRTMYNKYTAEIVEHLKKSGI